MEDQTNPEKTQPQNQGTPQKNEEEVSAALVSTELSEVN